MIGSLNLSIIIVNWNAAAYLRACIQSIQEYCRGLSYEIVVVDNASTDGDVRTLWEEFPWITVIALNQNLGFARANNIGFLHSSGRHVLFLNPDTKLIGPAIELMLHQMEALPNPGIVGCRQLAPDLSVQTTSIQKFPTIINQILNIEFLRRRWPRCCLWDLGPLFSTSRDPVAVEVIPGACMLLKRETFEEVGMFNEAYFMYAEDIELNLKVARTGRTNYYIPDARIIHYGGGSSQRQVSNWAIRMKYRAMGQFYLINRGLFYAQAYRASIGICALGRLLVLGLGYVFCSRWLDRLTLLNTCRKWTIVLRWACGLDEATFGHFR